MPKPQDPTASSPAPHAKDPIPFANRLLLIAARVSWSGFKIIVKTAVRIPRLFVRLNTRPDPPKPTSVLPPGTDRKHRPPSA
jgi:hypothetical protein